MLLPHSIRTFLLGSLMLNDYEFSTHFLFKSSRLEFSVTTLMSNHAIKRSLEPPQGSTQPLSRLTKNVRSHFLHRIFPSLIGTNPSFVAPECLLNWGKWKSTKNPNEEF